MQNAAHTRDEWEREREVKIASMIPWEMYRVVYSLANHHKKSTNTKNIDRCT